MQRSIDVDKKSHITQWTMNAADKNALQNEGLLNDGMD